MKLISLILLAASTLVNFVLAERLHERMSLYPCAALLILSAVQGLAFVGLVQGVSGFSMARATIIYDAVVIVCWYGMVVLRGEGLGFAGRVGLLLVATGVLLVFN